MITTSGKLYRLFGLLLCASSVSSSLHAQSRQLSPKQQRARAIYKQLVEINTVDSVGSATKAARAMAVRFLAAGFPARDVRVLVPKGKPAKGNLIVRYRGRADAREKPILLLAHLDVVAANRADWPRDPFTLHEENGFFLGRGVSDDKAMASMFVANLLEMRQEKVVPSRDIILALTADEEGGDANGVQFLVALHKELIDAAYAINEGGGGTLLDGRYLSHSIQAAEKVPEDITLTATNTGGHSSVPRPDNAIYSLMEAIRRIASHTFPVDLNPVSREFFAQSSAVEPNPALAAAMRALAANSGDSNAARVLSAVPTFNSIMRTTCVATRLSGGHAYNALPQSASANINCRIVPTSSGEATVAELKRVIGDTSISVSWTMSEREIFPTSSIQIVPELLAAATDLTKSMFGNIPVVPSMSTGATDGRFLRAAGIPTYGVSGIFSVRGETNAHGRDEKLRVKSYYEGLEFLDKLVRRLTARAGT
ncbi:MAG: M20/M25/M40 family metallo-hydrolase [Gemmatimonadaceae bacterium]|nr:M20/M25/M40 family metallo-hydrolase [Gemmatimonadaceae bacterium]